MSSGRNFLSGYRLVGTIFLAAGIGLAMVGCNSVPNTDGGPLDTIPSFGSKGKQEAFRKQVKNDPFPAAGNVGL